VLTGSKWYWASIPIRGEGSKMSKCPEHPKKDGDDIPSEQCHSPEDHIGPGPCRCTTYKPIVDTEGIRYGPINLSNPPIKEFFES